MGHLMIVGYGLDRIIEEHVTGAIGNMIWATNGLRMNGGNAGGGLLANNRSSTEMGAVTVLGSGWAGEPPAAAYAVQLSPLFSRFKQPADSHPRIELDHASHMIRFGSGVAATDTGIGRAASNVRIDTVTSATAPAAGAAAALPAAPAGYMSVYVGGAVRKVPYY
jgi:hypothetical protein